MEQLQEGVWVHEDELKLGVVKLPLRMTLVRLSGGGLWVHSPTTLSADLKQEVDGLGQVAALVAPNNGHNIHYMAWAAAYPEAARYVSAGIPKKLPKLTDYQILSNEARSPWPEEFEMQVMDGVPFFDECVFLHKPSASLIVTDFVQNHRDQQHTGVARVMSKLILEPIGFKDICLAPPLKFRFMVKNRPALVASVKAMLEWDFDRIIITHGNILETDTGSLLAGLCKRFITE